MYRKCSFDVCLIFINYIILYIYYSAMFLFSLSYDVLYIDPYFYLKSSLFV